MATKTKEKMKFEVTVAVELDPERIQEWRDEYPGAKVTQKDVVEMVREAVDEYVNGPLGDGRGAGDGYCGDPSSSEETAQERSSWIASMSPKIEVK